MKYHKIKNVPLEICTAEAKIAYNAAFSMRDIIKKAYDKCDCNFQRCTVILDGVHLIIDNIEKNTDITKKYDIDAIFCCLNAGLEKYINSKYSILTNYSEIGAIFASNYLNEN